MKWCLTYWEEGMPFDYVKFKWFESLYHLGGYLQDNPKLIIRAITREI